MLSLAFRNLWRNPKRSGITLAAIAVGVWALVFVWAFIDGINEQMIVNNIQYLTGHLKVHRRGYHEDKALALAMEAAMPGELSAITEGLLVTPRVEGGALVSTAQHSTTAMIFGVEPEQETRVTTLHKTLLEGRYLSGAPLELVLGDNLARELAVGVGDSVDLVVQAADGSIGADRFRLVGLFDTGIDVLDENLVILPLVSAQDLYSLWGRHTSWVLRVDNRQAVAAIDQRLQQYLGDGYEVYPWFRLLPSVVQAVAFHEAVAYIVLWVVFIVVAAGIANTLLMSVMERLREIGVMRALGTQGSQVLTLVLWESLILACLGLVAGNIIGIGFTYYWSVQGMDLSAYSEAMETMPGLSGIVYPLLRLDHLLLTSAVVFLVCLLPALPPAWRAARMDPVQAIRGITPPARIAGRIERWLVLPARWLWLQLAWRNLFRNPRRSALTGGATTFGMAAFIFLYALVDGFFEQMINNSTQLLSSHIQIKTENIANKEILFSREQIPEGLLEQPEILAGSERLVVEAMVGSAQQSLPISWVGVNPQTEPQVTKLHRLIVKGQYLSEGQSGIVIGSSLAEDLEVDIGQRIVITAQDDTGQLIANAVRIRGIFFSGSEVFDRGYVFSPITQVRELFGYPPEQISHWGIRLQERRDSAAVAERLTRLLSGTSLQATPWEQIMPVLVQMVDMTRLDFYLILAVIYVVVGMGVMNTMLMSVLERTREFGMLLAVGTEPLQVMKTVLYEALILGAGGILIGAVVGSSLAQYYHEQGINLSAFVESMAAIPGMTDRVYPVLIPGNLLVPALLLYVLGVLVAVYPAFKAARLQPVEALHGH